MVLNGEMWALIDIVVGDVGALGTGSPGAAETSARLAETVPGLMYSETGPARQPVCGYIPETLDLIAKTRGDLAEAISAIEGDLHWAIPKSYNPDIFTSDYLRRYAYAQIIGAGGPLSGDDFRMGLFCVAPDEDYPTHFHAAPEMYYPLTGPHEWQRGDGDWVSKPAFEMLWHDPWETHATRTGANPFLAVWIWTRDTDQPVGFT
jgi:quercetin dioxygenase-like cupin family protein